LNIKHKVVASVVVVAGKVTFKVLTSIININYTFSLIFIIILKNK